MVNKSILHYHILEKLGSSREILVFRVLANNKSIVSPGTSHEIPEESHSVFKSQIVISRGKGGIK